VTPVGVLDHELVSALSIHDWRSKDHGITPGFALPAIVSIANRAEDIETMNAVLAQLRQRFYTSP
jgi:hypothetical protein